MRTDRANKKRPASAMRGSNRPVLETELIDEDAQNDINTDLRDLSPDQIEIRSRANSRRRGGSRERDMKLQYSSSLANL